MCQWNTFNLFIAIASCENENFITNAVGWEAFQNQQKTLEVAHMSTNMNMWLALNSRSKKLLFADRNFFQTNLVMSVILSCDYCHVQTLKTWLSSLISKITSLSYLADKSSSEDIDD